MRAVLYDKYGSPDVLYAGEVPEPAIAAGEILVRVLAVTVNRTDCGFRKAEPWFLRAFSGLSRPRHRILGNEFAGEVVAIGSGVTRYRVGDQVCGLTGDTFGAYAEYLRLPADGTFVRKPEGFAPEEACALWDGPWLALSGLRIGGVGAGTELLIYGASGSIGSSAVQLAKHLGAHVTAVCPTPSVALVKSLGADEVVDLTRTDFTQLGHSFDVVLDAVGKSTFAACKPLLKSSGVYLSTDLGPWYQNPWLGLWTRAARGKQARMVVPDMKRVREDVVFLSQIVEAGKLRPVVDRYYALDQIVEAHRYVDSEQKVGSVVVRMAHP